MARAFLEHKNELKTSAEWSAITNVLKINERFFDLERRLQSQQGGFIAVSRPSPHGMLYGIFDPIKKPLLKSVQNLDSVDTEASNRLKEWTADQVWAWLKEEIPMLVRNYPQIKDLKVTGMDLMMDYASTPTKLGNLFFTDIDVNDANKMVIADRLFARLEKFK